MSGAFQLSVFAASYQFHRQTESFGQFLKRERTPALAFGIGFSAIIAAVVFFIDPSFFYPRMQTDALQYYLKGKALVETGSTAARYAINVPPFAYAAMPGVLRAPMIRAFSNFDDQLRAIQLMNVVLLDLIALMSAYIFSWVLPRERHWIAIGFAFCFSLITPSWMANVFAGLADAPYAAFFLASTLTAIRILVSPKGISGQKTAVMVFVVLFAAAFSFRYTAPILFVLAAALAKGRMGNKPVPRTLKIQGSVVVLALVLPLVFLSRQAIFGRYIIEPFLYIRLGDKKDMIVNFFSLAIPSQIIPGFELGLSRVPYLGPFHAQFGATHGDIAWCVVGAFISSVVILGAWRSRSRLVPELLMLLCVLPLLGLLMPSSARYLLTYQAFFWILFYEGARLLSQKVPADARKRLVPVARVLTGCLLAAGLIFGVSTRRATSGHPGESMLHTASSIPSYFAGVTATYRPLKTFLDSLPRSRAIIATSDAQVRWAAITGLQYYMVDSGLVSTSRKRDVYIVIECQSLDVCADLDAKDAKVKEALCRVGEFNYELVFEAHASRSRARVYRVTAA